MEQNQDKVRFAHVMAALNEIFDSGKELSAMKTELYFKCLESYPIEEVEFAARKLIDCRTTASFPKPAEFIECIEGNNKDKPANAWALVDQAMRKHGNYVSVNFGDRKIHRCLEMLGGWEYLGTLSEDEWKWKRKEFETLYAALPDQGPDYLPGYFEKTNLEKGFLS